MSEAVRGFLAEYVDGFQELELLVALAERGGTVPSEDLVRISRSSLEEFAAAFGRLRAAGAVAGGDGADPPRIALQDPRLDALVTLYRGEPVVVMRMLNSLAIERVRSGATRAFADAFLIRGKRSDG
jgi:hypothetical protein